MNPNDLAKIERWNYVIAGVFILASAFLFSARVTLGVAVGGILACANFTAMRVLITKSLRASGTRRMALQLLLMGKMGVLFVMVFLAIRFLPINPVALAVGMSVFLIAIAVESIRFSQSPNGDHSERAPDGRA